MRWVAAVAFLAFGCADGSASNDQTGGAGGQGGSSGSTAGMAGASGDAGGGLSDRSEWESRPCRMTIPDGLTEQDFTCGTLIVPLDWDGSGGDTVTIEAAVLHARTSPAEPDPFLMFGGGPGAWNLEGYLQSHATSVFAPINDTRDVVFFDQRGNGLSEPSLFCSD